MGVPGAGGPAVVDDEGGHVGLGRPGDIPQAAARAGHQDRAAGQRRSGQRQLGAGAGLGETVGQTELLGAGGDGHGDVSRSGLDGPHVVQAASGGAHLGEGIIKGWVRAHGRFPRILGF